MGVLRQRPGTSPGAGCGAFAFAPGGLPGYAGVSRRQADPREATMEANYAIIAIVIALSLVIGVYIGGKLRRKR
jgi:hypothetical protein